MIIVGDIGNTETKICLVDSKNKIVKRIILNTKKINFSTLKKSLYNLHSKTPDISLDSLLKNLFTNDVKENKPGALGIIMNNLVRLKNELVSEKDLDDFKGYMTGNLQIFFDDIGNLVDYYLNQLMFFPDNVKTIESLIDTYNKITIQDIQDISKKYFDFNKLNITILGDCNEKDLDSYIKNYYK